MENIENISFYHFAKIAKKDTASNVDTMGDCVMQLVQSQLVPNCDSVTRKLQREAGKQ